MNMERAKELNDRTQYFVIPDYSVIIHQQGQTIKLTGEEIARLHMDVSTQPEAVDVKIPGIGLGGDENNLQKV